MSTSKIKDSAEAQALAEEFAEKHNIDRKGPMERAKNWFDIGFECGNEDSRKALTSDALYSVLTKHFIGFKS
jgi:hypothetical protein